MNYHSSGIDTIIHKINNAAPKKTHKFGKNIRCRGENKHEIFTTYQEKTQILTVLRENFDSNLEKTIQTQCQCLLTASKQSYANRKGPK